MWHRRPLGIVCTLTVVAVAVASTGPAQARAHSRLWCQARSGKAWQRVLSRHVVPLSRTTPVVPLALANRGRSFFAEIHTKAFTGVAEIGTKSGAVTRIKAFPDPSPAIGSEQGDQAAGAFDGRWFVWHEYRGETSFNNFTTWAWDSRTGKRVMIGAATRDRHGDFWESPWRGPDVRNGIATWAQGVGPEGLTAVHVYDLKAKKGRVVHRGHAQGPFLLGGHRLAWPESPTRGAYTRMYVASALSGHLVKAPPALRGLRGISGLATDGSRVAYPSARFGSLWWSPSLGSRPQEIVSAGGTNHVDNSVQVGRRYIGFGIEPRQFVADTASHRYVQISGHGGFTLIGAGALGVLFASGSKLDPISDVAVVPLRDLPPVPACR